MDVTGDVAHEQTQTGRRYLLPGGATAPSVTTVVSRSWPRTNDGLERWRTRNVARHLMGDADAVGRMLTRAAGRPERMRMLTADRLAARMWEARNDYTAADSGTRVHAAVEHRLTRPKKGWARNLDNRERATAETALAALDGFEAVHVECAVYRPDKPAYAGRVDLVATDAFGSVCLIDLKTGRRFQRSSIAQMGGYAAATALVDADGAHVPMPQAERLLVLHAYPDAHQVYEIDVDAALAAWDRCIESFTFATARRGAVKL